MLIPMFVLAAGLLIAGPVSSPDSSSDGTPQGWIVEIRGYTHHRGALPKASWIIEFQWASPKAAPEVEAIETLYCDDLRAMFQKLQQPRP